jgi:hypothetical protein
MTCETKSARLGSDEYVSSNTQGIRRGLEQILRRRLGRRIEQRLVVQVVQIR